MDSEANPQMSCASSQSYAPRVCDILIVCVVPHWKAQFGKQCVSEVVAGILPARPPKYSVILDLDRKICDMELPKYALDSPPAGAPFSVVMQHFMPVNYRCLSEL
jgi:hypothetical protein